MSAVTLDLPGSGASRIAAGSRPRHRPVSGRPLVSRPASPAGRGGRSVASCSAVRVVAAPSGWHLTDRGLAVVMGLFLAALVLGGGIVIQAFLAFSNAPM